MADRKSIRRDISLLLSVSMMGAYIHERIDSTQNDLNDELTPDARKAYTLITGSPKNWLYRLRILFSPKFRTGDIRATILGKLRVLIGYT